MKLTNRQAKAYGQILTNIDPKKLPKATDKIAIALELSKLNASDAICNKAIGMLQEEHGTKDKDKQLKITGDGKFMPKDSALYDTALDEVMSAVVEIDLVQLTVNDIDKYGIHHADLAHILFMFDN